MQEIISTREAANRLEVSTRTITRGIHAGVFRAKYGGLYKNRIVGVYAEDVAELERRATRNTRKTPTRDRGKRKDKNR